MKLLLFFIGISIAIIFCVSFTLGVEFLAGSMLYWGLTTNYWRPRNENQPI